MSGSIRELATPDAEKRMRSSKGAHILLLRCLISDCEVMRRVPMCGGRG